MFPLQEANQSTKTRTAFTLFRWWRLSDGRSRVQSRNSERTLQTLVSTFNKDPLLSVFSLYSLAKVGLHPFLIGQRWQGWKGVVGRPLLHAAGPTFPSVKARALVDQDELLLCWKVPVQAVQYLPVPYFVPSCPSCKVLPLFSNIHVQRQSTK